VPHDVRDQIVDFIRRWSEKTGIGAGRFLEWLSIRASKFYDWRGYRGPGFLGHRLGNLSEIQGD
jgi:hypothetical protein